MLDASRAVPLSATSANAITAALNTRAGDSLGMAGVAHDRRPSFETADHTRCDVSEDVTTAGSETTTTSAPVRSELGDTPGVEGYVVAEV